MCGNVRDIGKWIETSNCFEVMRQLRKLDVLSATDLEAAMKMSRAEWLEFMKQKIGLVPRTELKNGRDYEKKKKKKSNMNELKEKLNPLITIDESRGDYAQSVVMCSKMEKLR